jgi:hypothetical protein
MRQLDVSEDWVYFVSLRSSLNKNEERFRKHSLSGANAGEMRLTDGIPSLIVEDGRFT